MFGAARVPIRMVLVPEHFGAMLGCKLLALYFVLIGREGQHVPAEVAVQRLRCGGGRPLLVGDGILLFLEGIMTVDNLALPRLLRRGILWSFSRHLRIDRPALVKIVKRYEIELALKAPIIF
jgi:hypothetical protein